MSDILPQPFSYTEELGFEAPEPHFDTFFRLSHWIGWSALSKRGITHTLDINIDLERSAYSITINLSPNPFEGHNRVLSPDSFAETLEWAQDPSRAQVPDIVFLR